MEDITSKIKLKSQGKSYKAHRISQTEIFDISFDKLIASFNYTLQKSKFKTYILHAIIKKNSIKLIQIIQNNVFILEENIQHYLYLKNNKIFYKKNQTDTFTNLSEDKKEKLKEKLIHLLQEENSFNIWTSNTKTAIELIKINTEELLIKNQFKLLKNKNENFDIHFTQYLLLTFQNKLNNQTKLSLKEMKTQFNNMLENENTNQINISSTNNSISYLLKISKNKAEITINNFDENKYIIINFNTYEIFLNNTLQNLSYFGELGTFFKTLNNDLINNVASITRKDTKLT